MMAPASLIDQESGPYLVVPILAGLAVFCTYVIGTYLHSRAAGVFAAALLCTSPIFLFQTVQPMSDVPATALWSLALVLALRRTRRSVLFAGLVTGVALMTRPNLLPLTVVGVAALMLRARPAANADDRPASQRLLVFFGGMLPIVAILLLLQWRLYGNPLLSGYGGPLALFSTSNVRQNVPAYGLRMLRGEAPALCVVLVALVIVLNRPRNVADRRRFGHLLLLASLAVAAILLCYLPYSVFADWFYLRFLLPAFPLVFTLVGASVVHAAGRLSPRVTGLFLLLVLAAACSFNILRAKAEQAFNLRDFEARYRIAGRYLQSMLPPEAVVVTVQESGSIRYYTQKPILRWDQLGTDIEAALVSVRSRGRRPMLLLEDWETSDFQSRFAGSSLARLDWQPRADVGDVTRVRLFDPADRTDPARRPTTDRLH
jgi:4-amino-4-deoxy-L-arabinose transferase-like glycosyltransferase